MVHDLTIFTIATDKYFEYWVSLVESAKKYLSKDISTQWIVFTNRSEDLAQKIELTSDMDLIVQPINGLEWPLPTLLRYSFINSVKNLVSGKEFMYLDADMLFMNHIDKLDNLVHNPEKKITLIMHPGFYRCSGLELAIFYLRNIKFIFKDLKLKIRYGSLGTWETKRISMAFVERSKRKKYVCGGVWFGEKNAVLEMCELLASRVLKDYSNNVVAKYHDESHLNWFATESEVTLLGPEYCFEQSYPQISSIFPKILAVNKHALG